MRSALALLALAACVPADQAISLGSVGFTLEASTETRFGLAANRFVDDWFVQTERSVLSFKTVTIGQTDNASACSYRGRGAATNVVFDARSSLSQIFNGLEPGPCPDVGLIFGPPDDGTTLGNGATGDDIVELAAAAPAHADLAFLAARGDERYRVSLRFDTLRTSSHFAGCRTSLSRGAFVSPNVRQELVIDFSVESFFREAVTTSAALRFQPFVDADQRGDRDGIVTMEELDALPLSYVRIYSDFYQLPNGSRIGSFGDFVRAQFKFAFRFGGDGQCFGNDPGKDDFVKP